MIVDGRELTILQGMIRLLVLWRSVELPVPQDWWVQGCAKQRGGFRLTQN
jgi:hypothetical protein